MLKKNKRRERGAKARLNPESLEDRVLLTMVPPGLGPGDAYHLAFVTSQQTAGCFPNPGPANGISAGDNFVNSVVAGTNSPVTTGATYQAILSDGTQDANNGLGLSPNVPIYNTNGDLIAADLSQLWDGGIDHPILFDEAGNPVDGPVEAVVWTGTDPVGVNTGSNGADWTCTDFATHGIASQTGPAWIQAGDTDFHTDGDEARVYGISEELVVPPSNDTGSIHGQKWHDLDGDGVQDPDEPGLDGWTIEVLDSTGAVIASQVTHSMDLNADGMIDPLSEQGVYWIEGIDPGDYQVRETNQSGWVQTSPNPQAVIEGKATVDNWFQAWAGSVDGATLSSLGPVVDGPHPCCSGTNILDGTKVLSSTTTTEDYLYITAWSDDGTSQGLLADINVNGSQVLSGPAWEVLPTGIDFDTATGPTLASLQGELSSATAASWLPVAVGPDNQTGLATIPTNAGIDLNANWMWHDTGAQSGASAPFVSGFDHAEYLVFRVPTGAGRHSVSVSAGQVIDGVNFGNTQPGSIHGKKYEDYNGNGQYDEQEIVIVGGVNDGFSTADGSELTHPRPGLAAEIGNPNPQAHYDATDSNRYFVESISFATPALPVASAFLRVHAKPLGGGVFNDSINLFSDDWLTAVQNQTRDAFSYTSLAANWNSTTYPNGHVIDIPITNALQDMIDNNRLDIYSQDDTAIDSVELHLITKEPCIPDWPIVVTGTDNMGNTVTASAHTMDDDPSTPEDETGIYWVEGLMPGSYTVSESMRAGWTQSSPDTVTHSVDLLSDDVIESQDFGNYRDGSIHGQKWHDLNGNGVRDPGEPGLDGWTIEIVDATGTVVASQVTHSSDIDQDGVIDPLTESGLYWIEGMKPGDYLVREVSQDGWEQTSPPTAVQGNVLADNWFQAFTGSESGSYLNSISGVNAGPNVPGHSVGASTTDDYLYVTAWSDGGAAQGLIGEMLFNGPLGNTVLTGSAFEVCPTSIGHSSPSGPVASDVAAQISSCQSSSSWTTPAIGPTNVPSFPGTINPVSNIDPGANWVWYDSGNQNSFNAPFLGGFDHDEYLIFRVPIDAGAHTVSVTSGNANQGVDFGNTELGSIHGKKYLDQNGNGLYDEEEIVIVGGVNDGFSTASGAELTNPRPGLAAEIGNPNPQAHYDATDSNRYFVESISFATPTLPIASAFLRVHAKSLDGAVSNDSINIFADDWLTAVQNQTRDTFSYTTLAGGPWGSSNFPNGHVIDIPITNALQDMIANNRLDIYSQDDTSIDYVELHLITKEACLADWPIEVSGTDGMGNTVSISTTTMSDDPSTPEDETGMYWIENLAPGTYTVSEGSRPGWGQSAPVGGTHSVDMASGDVIDGRDFGNYEEVSIHGQKIHTITRKQILTAGDKDNFGYSGSEPTTLSADLASFLSGLSTREFDEPGNNAAWGHSFTSLPSDIVSVSVAVHLKPDTSSLASNDTISFGVMGPGGTWKVDPTTNNSYAQGFHLGSGWGNSYGPNSTSGSIWNQATFPTGQLQTFTLNSSLIQGINTHGVLDIYVQDDTLVDYVEICVHYEVVEGLNGWDITATDANGVSVTQTTHSMDLNNDGQIDPATERGLYWLEGLAPGTHIVSEAPKAWWSPLDPRSGSQTVHTMSGDVIEDVDFENRPWLTVMEICWLPSFPLPLGPAVNASHVLTFEGLSGQLQEEQFLDSHGVTLSNINDSGSSGVYAEGSGPVPQLHGYDDPPENGDTDGDGLLDGEEVLFVPNNDASPFRITFDEPVSSFQAFVAATNATSSSDQLKVSLFDVNGDKMPVGLEPLGSNFTAAQLEPFEDPAAWEGYLAYHFEENLISRVEIRNETPNSNGRDLVIDDINWARKDLLQDNGVARRVAQMELLDAQSNPLTNLDFSDVTLEELPVYGVSLQGRYRHGDQLHDVGVALIESGSEDAGDVDVYGINDADADNVRVVMLPAGSSTGLTGTVNDPLPFDSDLEGAPEEAYYLEVAFDRPVTSVGGMVAVKRGHQAPRVRAFDTDGNEIFSGLTFSTETPTPGKSLDNSEAFWSVVATGGEQIARIQLSLVNADGASDLDTPLLLTNLLYTQATPLGDLNFDGAANNLDIDAVEKALANPEVYLSEFVGRVDYDEVCDANQDGRCDNSDIHLLEQIYAFGGLPPNAVPPNASDIVFESLFEDRESSDERTRVTRQVRAVEELSRPARRTARQSRFS